MCCLEYKFSEDDPNTFGEIFWDQNIRLLLSKDLPKGPWGGPNHWPTSCSRQQAIVHGKNKSVSRTKITIGKSVSDHRGRVADSIFPNLIQ